MQWDKLFCQSLEFLWRKCVVEKSSLNCQFLLFILFLHSKQNSKWIIYLELICVKMLFNSNECKKRDQFKEPREKKILEKGLICKQKLCNA